VRAGRGSCILSLLFPPFLLFLALVTATRIHLTIAQRAPIAESGYFIMRGMKRTKILAVDLCLLSSLTFFLQWTICPERVTGHILFVSAFT
jgi:hypothetical protein